MSEYARLTSDRLLGEIQGVEAELGPRVAGEIAEAYVDAGARYFEGDRILAERPEPLTHAALQNQI